MTSRRLSGVAILAAASVSIAVAETALEDTVLVTATRTPLALEDTLAPVIVITGEELRRQAFTDIAEALRFHASLEIGRTGGPGQPASLFLRGTNSNHTQVLVDGVRINPGTLGGAAIHHIRPQDIERIEIVKGPRSSLYGTEAIGGVVNIITRRGNVGTAVDAEAARGSHGTRSYGAGIRTDAGAGWYGGLRTDCYETDGYASRTGSTERSGHESRALNAHFGHRGEAGHAELRHWQARGNSEYLDFFLFPLDQDFKNRATALELSHRLGRATWLARLSTTTDEIVQSQSLDFARTRRDVLDLQWDHELAKRHTLTVGYTQARERTEAEVFGLAFDERPDHKALFGQWQGGKDGRSWVIATRFSDHDAFGSRWTGNAEFGQRLGDEWRVVLAAGTAFRAPDSTQRFGFGGNPGLAPERARSLEVGVRGRLTEHTRVEWNLYDNRIRDLVAFDLNTFALDNIDRARIQGTEFVLRYASGPWSVRQGFVLQRPRDLATDEPLPRRASRSTQTTVTFDATDTLRLGADLLLSSRRKDSGFGPAFMGGYGVLNLHAEWRVTDTFTLDARVENATDKRYETALTYLQPSRSTFLRLRWASVVAD